MVKIDFLDYYGNPEHLCFNGAKEVIVAHSLSDVSAAIEAVEDASANGFYAAGFISYEAAPAFDNALTVRDSTFPLVWFGLFDAPVSDPLPEVSDKRRSDLWTPDISQSEYNRSLNRISNAISSGETYQTNFTFRLRSVLDGDLQAYYHHLRQSHTSPYCAYIDTGDFTVVSNSPELFLAIDNDKIKGEPMKGTVLRGRYRDEDLLRRQALQNSEKDRAEHVMIVDLVRSDLGKIAKIGTVSVMNSFSCLALPTVWQMVSTVECERSPGVKLFDILAATFPGGSVTGAPKPRTMEIIRDEESSPRKVYCGAVGFIAPNGKATFSVPIRTIVVDNATGKAECGIGGGITSGSNAFDEYNEAMSKSRFLSARSHDFDLLESILLEDGNYFLLEEHLERLREASEYFRFEVNIDQVQRELLNHGESFGNGLRKVRLTAGRSGGIQITSEKIDYLGAKTVRLAKSAIDVNNPYVFHKTTRREMYERQKLGNEDVYDVLLWNEEGYITEFTTANVVAELDGIRYTPPVACGLLAGTLRTKLIRDGDIVERTVPISDLQSAKQVWLLNSVRKWVPVTFVD